MAFEVPLSKKDYPPLAFSSKYEKFLAPSGILLPPKQALKNKKLAEGAEKNLKKAFKITLSKIRKLKNSCAECGKIPDSPLVCTACNVAHYCDEICKQPRKISHAMVCDYLKQEHLDQVLECFPSPISMGKELLQGRGGLVKSWRDWFDNHTSLSGNIRCATSIIKEWWCYVGLKYPGDVAIESSLERMVTNVFTTVLTIAHAPLWVREPSLLASPDEMAGVRLEKVLEKKEIFIHLIGADKPELSAVETGIINVVGRILRGYSIHLTLISPDLKKYPETICWSPDAPLKLTDQISVSCYPGLYHNFWQDVYGDKDGKCKVHQPDVAIAIHPGCHTREMWILWKPTFELLAEKKIPVLLTTFNRAEHTHSLKVLQEIRPQILFEGLNPLGSKQMKQTPYEPDHVWAFNSYAIAIGNK